MKKIALAVIFTTVTGCSFAQNVFTYGNIPVSKSEFSAAFNKNPDNEKDRKKDLKEYLDLYINFKLKIRAAYDAGLNKDAGQQNELQNFRQQLADKFINDEANVKALVQQAFDRSQKEIHVAQVFIEVPENADTTEAFSKIQSAWTELKKGKDFEAVVQQFTNDEATRQSKGDIGFISVFTLPYQLENVVYTLKVNSFSGLVKTKSGYHIFKKIAERKSLGSRRIEQILVTFPPNATASEKNIAAKKADSIYTLLLKGEDFESLATKLSNDVSSSKGELPEFTTGTYSADFENVAFSLQKTGEISKPFETVFGFHIIKLLEAKPVSADINDVASFAALQEKVTKDKRLEQSKKELINKKFSLFKYHRSTFANKDLFTFTDSALLVSKAKTINGISESTILFSFEKQNIQAADWLKFVKAELASAGKGSKKNYEELLKEFTNISAEEYYRKNLDSYNADFAKQLKEFKEANLLFGIMEKNVWNKANTDTLGLKQYYDQHKQKYTWSPSADAIIITCNNEKYVEKIQERIKENPGTWRQINATEAMADSGRFELRQLAVAERTNFTAGLITATVKNPTDGTCTFNYIIRVYKEPGQRSLEDARGLVISDYQKVLEDKWIAQLKNKYPVKVNQQVFETIR